MRTRTPTEGESNRCMDDNKYYRKLPLFKITNVCLTVTHWLLASNCGWISWGAIDWRLTPVTVLINKINITESGRESITTVYLNAALVQTSED